MIAVNTRLPELRTVALLILLLIQLNSELSFADEELGLLVNSMPLSVFASAIEEGMSISIEVDESIADFTIDGQFNGSIESLLDDLQKRYGINHSVSDSGYKLWRDSDFSSQVSYQFQLSGIDIVTFLNYLSQAAGYRLLADTSIDINLDGAFNGTLREIIDNLSNRYPVLFYVSEDTISVVPESSFTKTVVLISDDSYSSESFLTDVRAKLPPGNFINREDTQLMIGGHPDFVKITESQLRIDMFDSASQIPDLLTAQIPKISDEVKNTDSNKPESKVPHRPVAGSPLAQVEKLDVLASILDIEFLLSPNYVSEVVMPPKLDAEYALVPKQDDEVIALMPNEDTEPLLMRNEDPEQAQSPNEDSELVLTLKDDPETTPTPKQDDEFALTPNKDTDFELTLKLEAVVSLIPKINTAFEFKQKWGAEFALTPKQDTKFALPPKHAAEFALTSILDAKLLVPRQLDAEFALPAKQVAEFALSPESEVEVAISAILDTEFAFTAEPEVIVFALQNTEAAVTPVPDAEVLAMAKRDALVEESVESEGEFAATANPDIEIAETLEQDDTDLSIPLEQEPEVTVTSIPNVDELSVDQIPGFY